VKWLLAEDLSEKARGFRDEFVHGLHELLAPDGFLVEAAHALTRAQRQGRVSPTEVNSFMDDLLTTPPELHAYPPLLARSIEISLQTGHGVYDCLYVALAEREACELLTADGTLINNLQPAFRFVTSLASLP
jgi:predicted nucleic acid-binding protein